MKSILLSVLGLFIGALTNGLIVKLGNRGFIQSGPAEK